LAAPAFNPVPARRQLAVYARGLSRRRPWRRPRAFLIFAQGRSGSELLVDLLNSSPDVHCDGEILERTVYAPTAWVEAHRWRHRDRVYGFKVKPRQLLGHQRMADMGRWLAAMDARGYRLVHLRRRNLLRQAVSTIAGRRDGVWHRRADRSASPPEAFHIDPAEVIRQLELRTRWGRLERAALAGLPHATVCYEDDLVGTERHQATLDRLAAWLDVESQPAVSALRPTNPGDLADRIANYDAVRAALRGGPWARYLEIS